MQGRGRGWAVMAVSNKVVRVGKSYGDSDFEQRLEGTGY